MVSRMEGVAASLLELMHGSPNDDDVIAAAEVIGSVISPSLAPGRRSGVGV
jgi:hypothetical protein